MQLRGVSFCSWFLCIFRSVRLSNLEEDWVQLNSFSFFVLIFMFLQNSRICRFRVALRAAEWFFILVLIFMYLQISGIHEFLGTLNAAKRCFILLLIFIYLQISKISQFRGRLSAAEKVFLCWFLCSFRTEGFANLESH